MEPARQNAIWFDEQTRILRTRLETAQKALSAYQQKAGIVTTEEALDIEMAKLNELSTQLTLVQGQTTDSHSKSRSTSGDSLAEVLQNPLINNLKTDIARLESKLQESNVNLGKNHPQTQRSESELAALKTRLDSETQKIAGSLDTAYRVGKQRESDLARAIEKQKERVLNINRRWDEINILKRDVESAQRAFEGVSQRASQTRLESLSIQTNAVVLNPASEPTDPSRPKLRLNLMVAGILGTLLGIGMSLLVEILDRRVRSEDDLEQANCFPFLAAIDHLPSESKASTTGRRRRFFTLNLERGRS